MYKKKFVNYLLIIILLLSTLVCLIACDKTPENENVPGTDCRPFIILHTPNDPFTKRDISITLKEYEYCDSFDDLDGNSHVAEDGHEYFISKWHIQGNEEFIANIDDRIEIRMKYMYRNDDGALDDKYCTPDAQLTASMNASRQAQSADKALDVTFVHDYPCKVIGERRYDGDIYDNSDSIFFQHMWFNLKLYYNDSHNISETVVFGSDKQYYFTLAEI